MTPVSTSVLTSNALELELKATSALFLGGADSSLRELDPELRVSAFRGVLRFWLRALLGNQGLDLGTLKHKEASILGGVSPQSGASEVQLRLRPSGQTGVFTAKRALLPHRAAAGQLGGQNPSKQALVEGTSFQLQMLPRLGFKHLPDEAIQTLLLMLHLGGLGNRSRRGFGSLQLVSVGQSGLSLVSEHLQGFVQQAVIPQDGNALAGYLRNLLTLFAPKAGSTIPQYPVLDTSNAKVIVCKTPYSAGRHQHPYAQPMLAFWGELHSGSYAHQPEFGGIKPRQASPIILHLAQTEAGTHLVITAFRSFHGNWSLVQDFLNAFIGNTRYDAEQVYGDNGGW